MLTMLSNYHICAVSVFLAVVQSFSLSMSSVAKFIKAALCNLFTLK